MIDMIADAESLLDELGDARAIPEVIWPAPGLSTFEEILGQLDFLLVVEFGRATRCRSSLQTIGAFLFKAGSPPSYRTAIDPKLARNVDRLQTLLQELDGFASALLEHFRAAMWSHWPPPARSIGH
jgi:hypothetical protein